MHLREIAEKSGHRFSIVSEMLDVGYRSAADTDAAYGVRLNPEKSRRITFTDEDKLIVLSES